MFIDLKDFYYNTPMAEYQYIQMLISVIPDEIIVQYKLKDIKRNEVVYIEIRKGIPGFKQAGKLASERLTVHLSKFGYAPFLRISSLWKHNTKNIMFTLVVDDFDVKFVNKADAKHLVSALESLYPITVDWSGTKYLGLIICWDCANHHVDISMPGYVESVLLKFNHLKTKQRDAPHEWMVLAYGAKVQYAPDDDDSLALNDNQKTTIQKIVGGLLYYVFAINSTMLVALCDITNNQSSPTQCTRQAVDCLVDYSASHTNAKIRFEASEMILWEHSDASYLSLPRANSRAGAVNFLVQKWPDLKKTPKLRSKLNGFVHVVSKIIRPIVSSAAESEIVVAFLTAQGAVPIRTTLADMGQHQPATLIVVDNST